MAAIYKNGKVVQRWRHKATGSFILFMSNGKLLQGSRGRYRRLRVKTKAGAEEIAARLGRIDGWERIE